MKMGTKVTNPTYRRGRDMFTACTYCKRYYTSLGISRHWGRCPENPKNRKDVHSVTR